MTGLNKAYFIGHIGREPEITRTNGVTLASISVATPNPRVADDGTEIPDWHRLTASGAVAAYLARHAREGTRIAVECSVRQEKWTDATGTVRYETRLVIERVLWVAEAARGGA